MPRRRFVARLVVAVVGTTLMAAAFAQSPDPRAPTPLREALQAAWRQHPTYQSTESQLSAARARRDAAGRPLYNPELVFDYENEGTDRTATAGVDLTLDINGKRRAREASATARLDEATARAHLQRRDFAKDWFAALADWIRASERVRTGERRIGLLSRFAELAQKQFAADDISGLDRDLALLARDEAEAEQATLLADQAEAAARFRSAGGDPAMATLPEVALPAPLSNGDSEAAPEIAVALAAASAAEREVDVARKARTADPTVGLRGGRVEYDDLARDNVVGFTVTIPLNIRNGYRAEVVAAEADAVTARADADRIKLQLDAERQRAIDSYASTRAAWTRWTGSRGTDVGRREALLERLWREGELSTADYLLQLKQSLDTELARAELQARTWRAYADYLAATGQLERWAGLEGTP
ncbi:TolC family protein [Noviluteimonas gilva]|nr:TolC family protein [Lysobacter gilvus]